ncbi:hypothetical protein HELRODRAFT_194810 [Helobdella robusta]|uniref:Peptidase M12B domain-containing protein n=1 Tax=Helobdella robusta TaxID=6412 RepID=T1FWF7_HELRO|nr:hypothetical protein HELRODRAFT_194810 [Helobdella robusta]ESO11412.1 hypothetical protein HELRODRAFT_194810 [Helobdella robusta]
MRLILIAAFSVICGSTLVCGIPEYSGETENYVVETSENSRLKRAGGDLLVEALYIIDYSLYKLWLSVNKNNRETAIQHLRYHFGAIAQGVNKLYQGISGIRYTYSVKIVGYYICETAEESYFIENHKTGEHEFNIDKALKEFGKWNANRPSNPKLSSLKFDLAIAFTSYSSGTFHGLANTEGACTPFSLGIVRNTVLETTTFTAAHEMAHILGSGHDGYQNNCRGTDNYLMSPSRDEYDKNNYDKFSFCSKVDLEKLALKLENEGKNCLSRSNVIGSYEEVAIPASYLPGTLHTPDEQCQLVYGLPSFKFCNPENGDFKSICSHYTCWDVERQVCTYDGGKGLPGTTCGNKMWCSAGRCVSNPNAPAANDTCMYGNTPEITFPIGNKRYSCQDVEKDPRNFCNRTEVKSYCCWACRAENPNWCLEDRFVDWCKQNLNTEKKKVASCKESTYECCKTCEKYV